MILVRRCGRHAALICAAAIALALVGCSTTTPPEPTVEPQSAAATEPTPTAAQEEAAINGMIETYNALVATYTEAGTAPVDPAPAAIQARTQGAVQRQLNSFYQRLFDEGLTTDEPQNERIIIDVIVDSATTGRIRECTFFRADLTDVHSGEIVEEGSGVSFVDNFYELDDGIWKLARWGERTTIDSLDECPIGMRDDPRFDV